MIDTMNEQQMELVNKMWEQDLSYEADLKSSSPTLNVNLYDDGVSFPHLESELKEVLNPPTSLLIIAPSSPSTFRNDTAFMMTFSDTSSPVAKLMEFEVGDTFGISAKADEDDTSSDLGDAFIKDHVLDAIPLGRLYVDNVATILTSPDLVDNISP